MATSITVQEYKLTDFVSIDSGTEKVTLTFFNARIIVGMPGWATSVEMTPEQAKAVANDLLVRANRIESAKHKT